MPMKSGCVPGKPPRPIRVVVVGMPSFSAKVLSSLDAFERRTPPPEYMTGLLDLRIKSMAFFICPGWPL